MFEWARELLGGEGSKKLSKEEFDKVAALYSKIKSGQSDIKFDFTGHEKDAPALKAKMMEDMANMMRTKSGRELLGKLANNEQKDKDGNVVHHTTIGVAGNDDDGHAGHGGHGRDARIEYHPGRSMMLKGPADDPTNPKSAPLNVLQTGDTTLFHEMVHALHDTRGTTAQGRQPHAPGVSPLDEGVMRWELQATGLGEFANDPLTENAYRRELMALGVEGIGPRSRYVPDWDKKKQAEYDFIANQR